MCDITIFAIIYNSLNTIENEFVNIVIIVFITKLALAIFN